MEEELILNLRRTQYRLENLAVLVVVLQTFTLLVLLLVVLLIG